MRLAAAVHLCRRDSQAPDERLWLRVMPRIALVLLLYVLLSSAPHMRLRPPLPLTALAVRAEPLDEARDAGADYGPLRLTGLWRLRGSVKAFGGVSALLANADGSFLSLADSGEAASFVPGRWGSIAALPRMATAEPEAQWKQDSESMTRDPVSGRIWVGFERVQRICRFAPAFVRIERCVSPPAVQAWPEEGGLESLVRLGDGRFLALSERRNGADGGFDVLLWAGDPVDAGTAPPVHMLYRGVPGYRPTDAVWLGGDRLLVLERRLTFWDGFMARLTLVRMPRLRGGAVLRGEAIARFERPGPADNMEALALGRDAQGQPVLYVASDDNHLFLQRTLLFRFALPDHWVSDRPAP